MINIKTSPQFICMALMISGCATHTSQNNGPAATTLPPHSVVLMDPSIDDGMLPALGEGLSKGAVTIYSLNGQNAPLPLNVIQQQQGPITGPRPILNAPDFGTGQIQSAPLIPMTGNPVSITRPTNMTPGNNDPRVTLFNPDSGSQKGTKKEMRPPATDPALRPPLLPPPLSDKTQPLKSPFDGSNVLGTPKDTTTWNPPPTIIGSDRRAVMAEDLMTPTLPPTGTATSAKPPRPPKGMTY